MMLSRLPSSVTFLSQYRTNKVVKTFDKSLVRLHLFFMFVVAGFAVSSIIFSHNYMAFDDPAIFVETILVTDDYDTAFSTTVSNLAYCVYGTAATIYEEVDYIAGFDTSLVYTNPQCVTPQPAEFTQMNDRAAWIYTHFRETMYSRTCSGTYTASANVFDTCSDAATSVADAYVARAETLKLKFKFRVKSENGIDQLPDKLIIGSDTYYPKRDGSYVEISVTDLLALAGVDLDADMTGYAGSATRYVNSPNVPYRFMGAKIILDIDVRNTREFAEWDPFNYDVVATVTPTLLPTTERYGPGKEYHYTADYGTNLQSKEGTWSERDWSGVLFSFHAHGDIGAFEYYALIATLVNAFVLIALATVVTDFVGEITNERFQDDKYEDDGERTLLENMAENYEKKEHKGVPFNPRFLRLVNDDDEPGMSYENAIYDLYDQVRDVRDRLNMIPQDEAEFVEGSGPNHVEGGHKVLHLVEQMTEQQVISHMEEHDGKKPEPFTVDLHQGAQMMGRGVGGVWSKAVSRQQFTLTIVKEKIRMKALRDGPGYMIDDSGRYDPLPASKAVVLKEGDQVVFRLREGKLGGHLGVFKIEEKRHVEKSWLAEIFNWS